MILAEVQHVVAVAAASPLELRYCTVEQCLAEIEQSILQDEAKNLLLLALPVNDKRKDIFHINADTIIQKI